LFFYKDLLPLMTKALSLAKHKPSNLLVIPRPLLDSKPFDCLEIQNNVDRKTTVIDYQQSISQFKGALIDCEWIESNDPSYM
jgi:hypothetical protein